MMNNILPCHFMVYKAISQKYLHQPSQGFLKVTWKINLQAGKCLTFRSRTSWPMCFPLFCMLFCSWPPCRTPLTPSSLHLCPLIQGPSRFFDMCTYRTGLYQVLPLSRHCTRCWGHRGGPISSPSAGEMS